MFLAAHDPYCSIYHAGPTYDLRELVCNHLPETECRILMIKPNWVRHEENSSFPIEALVTSSSLIEAVIEACLEKYKGVREITVGDVPLQSCDWEKLKAQAGVDSLIEKYGQYNRPRIRFLDLRREKFKSVNGFFESQESDSTGDPKGYREVVLNDCSFLDPISDQEVSFRVSDYDPQEIQSSHRKGVHHYLISGSVLDCDLFINLPKMKTHQKAGITGALKNLVGINGQKAYLAHFRRNGTSKSGDEFPPDAHWPIVLQTRVREMLQKRSRWLFRALRPAWHVLRYLYGLETEGTSVNLTGKFYIGSGSWYGNDTIWRMVYDLNKIIQFAPRAGTRLETIRQREYVAIMDGIVAGQGNGPLQPLPVDLGVTLYANDPFLMDMTMAQLMGFDFKKVPSLRHFLTFQDVHWAKFDPNTVPLFMDGARFVGVSNLPVLHNFIPAPGWQGHLEIEGAENESKSTRVL